MELFDLRYYNTIQTIKLTQEDFEEAKRYSNPVVATVKGNYRNQNNPIKIEDDHLTGKVGEIAVRKLFSNFIKNIIGPDFRIYNKHNKSWDADLFMDGVSVHVKTQKLSQSRKFKGLSWTFQCGDERRDKVLDEPLAWIVCVQHDDINDKFYVYPPRQIRDMKFDRPVLDKHVGEKKVVYVRTLFPEFPEFS